MHLSRTITGLTGGGSDGWDLFLKARRMIAEGTRVTELTIGEHDVRTAPHKRVMHMHQISDITIFAASLPRPRDFYLDNVKLQ